MHRKAEHRICHTVGVRQVVWSGAVEAAVGGKVGDKGVKITAGKDVVRAHFIVERIAGHAVMLRIDEDREVGVVVSDARHIIEEGDALHATQSGAVEVGHVVTKLDGGIHLTEVEQAVGCAHLVHLGVDTGGHHCGLAVYAEIFEVVDVTFHSFVLHYQRTALDGVEHLGSVEREGAHIAGAEYRLAVYLHAEGMGCIVDHFQAVGVGNLLNAGYVAGLAVAVHRHNGGGAWRDGGLDALGVDGAGCGVDIHKDGLAAVPPDGVRCGNEAVWGGDYLAGDAQSLQGCEQRQGAVSEEAQIWHTEVFGQCGLETAVERAVVRNPFGIPYLTQTLDKLIEVGQQWGCY